MKHLMEEKIGLTTQGSDGLVEHEIQYLTAQLVLPLNMISRFVHSGDCAGKKPLPWNRTILRSVRMSLLKGKGCCQV